MPFIIIQQWTYFPFHLAEGFSFLKACLNFLAEPFEELAEFRNLFLSAWFAMARDVNIYVPVLNLPEDISPITKIS